MEVLEPKSFRYFDPVIHWHSLYLTSPIYNVIIIPIINIHTAFI